MSLPLPFTADAISLGYGAFDGTYYTDAAPHQGDDFSSASRGIGEGTPFRASGPGRVVRSGFGPSGVSPNIDRPNSLAGNSIDVDYGACITRYMHRPMDSPSPAVGDETTEGTLLGVIGATGLVSAPHLHMETWDKATGRRVDPANFFDYNRVVSEEDDMPTVQEIFNYSVPKFDASGKRVGETNLAAVLGWSDANNGSVVGAIVGAILDGPIIRQGLPAGDPRAGKPTSLRAVTAWSDAASMNEIAAVVGAVNSSLASTIIDGLKGQVGDIDESRLREVIEQSVRTAQADALQAIADGIANAAAS